MTDILRDRAHPAGIGDDVPDHALRDLVGRLLGPDSGVLCDQVCTTQGPQVNYVR